MAENSFGKLILVQLKEIIKIPLLSVSLIFVILAALLIGFIFSAGVVNDIPTAIVDLDNTSLSRTVTQEINSSTNFNVSYVLQDYPTLIKLLNQGKIKSGIVIPPGFSSQISSLKGSDVLLLTDGTNYIVSSTALTRALEVLKTVNAGISIKAMEGKGLLPIEASNLAQLIQLEQDLLFNPNASYSNYLTYGIVGIGAFSLLMGSFGVVFAKRFEKTSGLDIKEIIAILLVLSLIAILWLNVTYIITTNFFKLPMAGSRFDFFILTIFYGILAAGFGLLLFLIASDEVKVFQASTFFATPLFFITGYSWPIYNMPVYLQFLSYLCPISPFILGARAVLVMGADLSTIIKYVWWMIGLIALYLPLGLLCYSFKYLRKKSYSSQAVSSN